MGEILRIIEDLSGGTCHQSERFTLDHFIMPEYQDEGEIFDSDKIFEKGNRQRKNVQLPVNSSSPSLFQYFLDGARRTYKIVDFGSTDGKFLPIVAGQIGAAICVRENKRLKKYKIKRDNVIAVPADRMGDSFDEIETDIKKLKLPRGKKKSISIGQILPYQVKAKPDRPFEYLAIAKIQITMMDMEIKLIQEMVDSNKLEPNKMLMIDGSLQFNGVQEGIFENVIGVSKSFNPNMPGLFKSKHKQVGSYLAKLKFGERSPVYVYQVEGQKRPRVGAWYLRIHHETKLTKPLDGIVKVEKIATTVDQKENGFDTDMVNEISRSILLERNVTCYGNDLRWANHLYPIYLTEMFLKSSFISDTFFLNIF